MGERIVVRPINKGLRNDRIAPNIDDDSFPTLINAYQWRGRVKRKRGTSNLTRLQRHFDSTSISYKTPPTTITLNGSGIGNILTGFGLDSRGNIIPGSVTLVASGGPTVYTDPTQDGYLTPTGTGGPNLINYATGQITIPAQAGNTVTAVFNYFPGLPVMGLEELNITATQFPGTIGFDTTFSYNINTAFPWTSYDVSFYKNPPADPINLPGYVPKANETPTSWNGQDYQQFWSTNYENALWVTNGINVPFSTTNIGMQYKFIDNIAVIALGPPAILTLTIANHGLVVGDFVFINEVPTATLDGINFQTGYVILVVDANNVNVEFPNATLVGAGGAIAANTAIAQYLTNRSDITKDSLRFYDGDPTDGNSTTPTLNGTHGWVNFAPPLSKAVYSIAQKPEAIYYLVGARMIVGFKDRLLFLGAVIQTKAAGSQIYLQDTIIYSQNGTPYYTASFTGDPSLVFHPILVPTNQTATVNAYWADQTGFGGFITAGTDQPMLTVGSNEDALIIGFENLQTKLIYSGNDIIPFNFFLINSELGSSSTFSTVNMDQGVITRGSRGYVVTSQRLCERIDLIIPDEVFEINLQQNGFERVCSQRDFINEWIYFTYNTNQTSQESFSKFPGRTLQYNYREQSWAIFNETYTTYGSFKKQSGFIWSTVGLIFPTWNSWNEPWNAGSSSLLEPIVIAGNQQGFVLTRDDGTDEANSLSIQGFSGNTVTSINHGLTENDYIVISGALGTVSSQVNGLIFSVIPIDANSFTLSPSIGTAGTYFGGGLIKKMYIPLIQTKQFPVAWEMARKTRIGVQQYLFTTTQLGQVTLFIYLSQNSDSPYNNSTIVPDPTSLNDGLIYSTILYTCPESKNLGLTPANINLQTPTAIQQEQLWHRMNTSLIGDTVQIGFTLSDTQMRDTTFSNQFAEIELHSMILDVTPSQLLV